MGTLTVTPVDLNAGWTERLGERVYSTPAGNQGKMAGLSVTTNASTTVATALNNDWRLVELTADEPMLIRLGEGATLGDCGAGDHLLPASTTRLFAVEGAGWYINALDVS